MSTPTIVASWKATIQISHGSYVPILDFKETFTKVPLPLDLEQCCIDIEWKDLSPTAAIFSCSSLGNDQYKIFSRHLYVAGFFYALPFSH